MQYKIIQSTITFLKMDARPCKQEERNDIKVKKVNQPISVKDYKALYNSVGESLNWLDRIFMDDDILSAKINNPRTHIYQFFINDNHAGYCELITRPDYTEILYFGLIPDYVGKGYGKYLLNKTIELAWSFSPRWIQLNTCDLDHHNALATYEKAGFKAYKTVTEEKKVKQ